MWVTGEYYDALRDAETAARRRLDDLVDPFSRLDWFKRSWKCEPLGHRPLIVRTRVSGAECWLFFVRERPNRLAPMAGPHSLRFGPVFVGDPDRQVRQTLLRAAARRLRKFRIARLGFGPLPPTHAVLVRDAFRSAGWVVTTSPAGESYTLNVGDQSFDDYWDGRPDGLHERIATGSRTLNVEIADLLSPRIWDEVHLLGGADHFLKDLAEDATLDRSLRLAVARVGDAPVAAQLWTSQAGRAWRHWRMEDRAARHLFPSDQLTAAMLRYLINVDHVQAIDFGPGSNALALWTDAREPLVRVGLYNPGTPSIWVPALRARLGGLVRRRVLD